VGFFSSCQSAEQAIFSDGELGEAIFISSRNVQHCDWDIAALKSLLSDVKSQTRNDDLSFARTILFEEHSLVKKYKKYAGVKLIDGQHWWFLAIDTDAKWILTNVHGDIQAYEYPDDLRPHCESS